MYNGYTDQFAAVSHPENVGGPDQSMFPPRDMLQNGSSGQMLEPIDFDVTGFANGVDMERYLMSDLEMGQFFVPDEFERWVHGGANTQMTAG